MRAVGFALVAPVGALLVAALVVQTIRLERLRDKLAKHSKAWAIEAILEVAREVRRGE